MNKWKGNEAIEGLGGELNDESVEYLRKAEVCIQHRQMRQAGEYTRMALRANPENLDALILQATCEPLNKRYAACCAAEQVGRKLLLNKLGPTAFDDDGDYVGHFWSLLPTRPYMRALATCREIAARRSKWDEALEHGIEMLRLCPGDNMSVRDALGTYLIHLGRHLEALNFILNWSEHNRNRSIPPRGGTVLDARRSTDIDVTLSGRSGAQVKYNISGTVDSGPNYTGALASFEVFGDCELSRYFLRTAVKANPIIIRRILGHADQPDDFCFLARQPNGLEFAIDYLFLAQHAWYTNPKVLEWVNNDPEVAKVARRACSNPSCQKQEEQACAFETCSSCKDTVYCSRECQVAHWKLPGESGHKKKCKETQRHNKAMASVMQVQPDLATADSEMFIFDGSMRPVQLGGGR